MMLIADWIGNFLLVTTLALMACAMTAGVATAWRAGHKNVKGCIMLLTAVVLVRFGGGVLLEWNDMGWRTTPRNLMDVLLIIALLLTIYQTMAALTKAQHPWAGLSMGCGFLLILVILLGAWFRFQFLGWTDHVTVQNEQSIVVEEGHKPGNIGGRRYYLHVNGIVHGPAYEL